MNKLIFLFLFILLGSLVFLLADTSAVGSNSCPQFWAAFWATIGLIIIFLFTYLMHIFNSKEPKDPEDNLYT